MDLGEATSGTRSHLPLRWIQCDGLDQYGPESLYHVPEIATASTQTSGEKAITRFFE